MENKIYALMGAHGSGKTTLAASLLDMGINFIPVYTTWDFGQQTRSRQSNTCRKLFNLVTRAEFEHMDFVIEFTHKGEAYGYRKDDILNSLRDHTISIMVLEIPGLKPMSKLIKKKLETIFLMVDYVTLVDRLLRMGCSNDEIKRHLQYAESNKEFDLWKICNHIIRNTCDKETALIQLLAIMGLTTLLPQAEFDKLIK